MLPLVTRMTIYSKGFLMNPFKTLTPKLRNRRYSLIKLKGKTKLACFVDQEWIIDATCKSINEMIDNGLVSKDSVRGWVSQQCFTFH